MPQIRLTRHTVVNRVQHMAGDIVVATDSDARYLKAIGKAIDADADYEPPAAADKPLSKMNKPELQARATELGLTFDESATNAALRELIESSQK